MIPKAQRDRLRVEGRLAYEQQVPCHACPYPSRSVPAEAWSHGWWEAYHMGRSVDAARIAAWLYDEALIAANTHQASALGQMLINSHTYLEQGRTMSLPCDLGGTMFTVPAPATLKQTRALGIDFIDLLLDAVRVRQYLTAKEVASQV